jgi:hypothetical protein
MIFKKLITVLAAATLSLPLCSAHAGVVTLTTEQSEFGYGTLNQGWWTASPSFSNTTENDNHYTGSAGPALTELRSFYTFDLSGVSGKVTGVTLRVMRGDQSGNVNLTLWDVSTPANVVNNNNGYSGAIFTDLGTGKSYGNFDVISGWRDEYLDFGLNAQGLNDLRNTNGFFTIGASVNAAAEQFIFSSTGGDVSSLILEVDDNPADVPEPTSLALLLAGAASIVAARRHK